MAKQFLATLDGSEKRFACIVSRFSRTVTDRLLQGAVDCLIQHGVTEDRIDVVWVPGSFEIPLAAQAAARSGRYDAILGLGCVIRGETAHFDHVAGGGGGGRG
ncbi:MAG: 6,7-dimethyl-8-ribityllumazine synthase, partial [Candidatus Eisenbacteria bacterium]|nr:6,7-dimethyl-8-ribityllumazine synthase [Candidatus Eisenbacteria bacterium]